MTRARSRNIHTGSGELLTLDTNQRKLATRPASSRARREGLPLPRGSLEAIRSAIGILSLIVFIPLRPPCPLCDAFPFACSRRKPVMFTKLFCPLTPIPLCDLRALCAMLFHSRVLARKPAVFTQALSSTTPNFPL
jgi:hypothetical protein